MKREQMEHILRAAAAITLESVHEMLKMRIVDRASVTSVVDELLPKEKALALERLNSLE